ncbi:cobalamin B12-binding domain-containing protein [Streptomyces sp. TRM68367]|uniref:cobalamin B12-binding domain-containing protein n=1 Tax=Streptomyces sp. TRM68367 TaxID=2758415 RepID=UPI0021D2A579|nr:cobalamin-dependent protein [Streptomyces sp. TRM68367]
MMEGSFRCLLSTVESDSHFWNLIYLERLLEEHGAVVRNLGGCTPAGLVVDELAEYQPDLLVVSSINGHGYYGARDLMAQIQHSGLAVPCVVGGKLTTSASDDDRVRRDLLAQGFTDVFLGDDSVERFRGFLHFGSRFGFAAWRPDAPVVAPWDGPEQVLNLSPGR